MRKRIHPSKPLSQPLNLRCALRLLTNAVESVLPPPDGFATPCWEWRGHRDRDGYGQIKVNGRAHWVHRISYQTFKGKLLPGDEVDHGCRNHSCLNPEHLRRRDMPGNRSDNGRNHAPPPLPEQYEEEPAPF